MGKDIVETAFVIWNSETSNNTKYLGELVMDTDRCVSCGVVVPEGRQVCWGCERQTENYHCVICGKEMPQPKLAFGGRKNGKTMMEFQHNMRQLCCSDQCFGKFVEIIKRELNE